jgi:protein-tyrosine phosphatase
MQITAGSLCGRFGPAAEAFCHELLARNWVHFVASDAHHPRRRPPLMKDAHALIKARMGEETAKRLFVTNPHAALRGIPLPAQPEPRGLEPYMNIPFKFNWRKYAEGSRGASGARKAGRSLPRSSGLWKMLFSR